MKKYIRFSILLVISAFIFQSCSSSVREDTPPPTMKALSFDYIPPEGEKSSSTDITFAIINPQFVETFKDANYNPYKTFAKNMGNDFMEMLTARGYPYKGPFDTYDLMVYNDKKFTDLVLIPIIDIQFAGDYLRVGKKFSFSAEGYSKSQYYYDGDLTVTGKLNLEFSEPFTKTKVLVKSIQIQPITFKFKSYYTYDTKNIPVDDPMVWNCLIDNLTKIYKDILTTAWNHLEYPELIQKKYEADEIKQNSGFLKN